MDVPKFANLVTKTLFIASLSAMSKRSKAILESTKCKICHNKNSLEGVINISHWWHCIVSIFSFLVQLFCKSSRICILTLSIYFTFAVAAKFATKNKDRRGWTISDSDQERGKSCVRNIRGARRMWAAWRVAAVSGGGTVVREAYFQTFLLAGMLAM